ncbi:DUF1534 domain-containing protein, partial [Pseudomonas syringae pv. actinidiae]|nr:DUF1534 domain-containing protein [Pseudomonas syringae pv. actinidiae]
MSVSQKRSTSGLSFRTLQRRNALRDALRRKSAPRGLLKIRRRASR